MSLVLQVDILGEYKNLTAATKGAQNQLGALNKRAQSISNGMNKAFAAIGIGFSLGVLKRELEDATKAAIEDSKSQQILALAMENTGKATSKQVAEAEKAIKSMQIQSAVADDKIRPAYQKLFLATGDVTKSNKLMQVALDAAAFSGKDLNVVSQAMAKSLAGSDTALVKLIPSLKNASDPMAELERMTRGAADAAADLDPYARMQQIFGELQEQVGMALLPVLNQFSDWLATPEGQAKLQEIVDGFVAIIAEGIKLVEWVVANKDWLVPMVVAIGAVTAAWKIAMGAVEAYRTAVIIAQALGGPAGWASLGIGALALGAVATASGNGKTTTGQSFSTSFGQVSTSGNKTTVQNVVIQGSQSAQQIKTILQKSAKSTGTKLVDY